MFFKAARALSKFNSLFHLKSKINIVTLRKCNLHLQYYKIDLIFSIKSQEINMYAKNIKPSAKRDDRIMRPGRARTCELPAKHLMRMCPRSVRNFSLLFRFLISLSEKYPKIISTIRTLIFNFILPFYGLTKYRKRRISLSVQSLKATTFPLMNERCFSKLQAFANSICLIFLKLQTREANSSSYTKR